MQFDNQAVGAMICRYHKEKGMTQELLSGLTGIARSHLSMIENGSKQPNFETVWRIAEALEIRPSELVAEIERKFQITKSRGDHWAPPTFFCNFSQENTVR